MHRGVEAVPAELVLQPARTQPGVVLMQHRSHRVSRSLSDLDPDSRAEKIREFILEAESPEDFGKFPFEGFFVLEERSDRIIHLGGLAGFEEIVVVDVMRLQITTELVFHLGGKILAHIGGKKIHQHLLDVCLRNLPMQFALSRNRGRMLGVVGIECLGDFDLHHPVVVAFETHDVLGLLATERVHARVPIEFVGSIHDRAGNRTIDVAAENPGEGSLLVNAVRFVVSGLQFLPDEPMCDQLSIRFEPSLAGGVHHRSHRYMEVRHPV